MGSHRHRMIRVFVVLALATLILSLAAPVGAADDRATSSDGVLAEYSGRTIDLSKSWEGAMACHVAEDGAWCFDSEKEMRAWLVSDGPTSTASGSRSGSCSGSLTLYDGTSYTGAALSLSQRGTWLNLSGYGFNQRTSSYKIGPCSARFADWADGGGAKYPSYLTQAYDQATSMIAGWNNDVSSVYIY